MLFFFKGVVNNVLLKNILKYYKIVWEKQTENRILFKFTRFATQST